MKSKNFIIKCVFTDREFASLSDFFHSIGCKHDMCGAGSHVSIAENKIRTLKNRARAIYNSLPFTLPNSLVKYLIYFATQAINLVLTKHSISISSLENFIGRFACCFWWLLSSKFSYYRQLSRSKNNRCHRFITISQLNWINIIFWFEYSQNYQKRFIYNYANLFRHN